jgi:hypothetical protein
MIRIARRTQNAAPTPTPALAAVPKEEEELFEEEARGTLATCKMTDANVVVHDQGEIE